MSSLFLLLIPLLASADTAGVKINDIETSKDTTITVKKGAVETQCLAFEIIQGSDEIAGDPEFDRAKAHSSWKAACADWKKSMREMNKDNQILSMSCNSPKGSKESDRHTFVSSGSYKNKVRVREKM